jgi:hypothetical protein
LVVVKNAIATKLDLKLRSAGKSKTRALDGSAFKAGKAAGDRASFGKPVNNSGTSPGSAVRHEARHLELVHSAAADHPQDRHLALRPAEHRSRLQTPSRAGAGPVVWFNSVSSEEFHRLYGEQLGALDPRQILARIEAMAEGFKGAALLCYERTSWCHSGVGMVRARARAARSRIRARGLRLPSAAVSGLKTCQKLAGLKAEETSAFLALDRLRRKRALKSGVQTQVTGAQ